MPNAIQIWLRSSLDQDAALVQNAEVIELGCPHKKDLAFLQERMRRPRLGNISLSGTDHEIWSKVDVQGYGVSEAAISRRHLLFLDLRHSIDLVSSRNWMGLESMMTESRTDVTNPRLETR
jgi:hypothetical protein